MKRGLLAPVMMIAILLCAAGATLALSGQFSAKQSAAQKQYGPGKGCGHKPGKKKGNRPNCKRKCPKKKGHNPHCRMNGTNGNDDINGGKRPETIYAGRGNDHIYARGGGRDVIHCGGGRDVVYVDAKDKVSKDCEVVHRSSKKKHPKTKGANQHGRKS